MARARLKQAELFAKLGLELEAIVKRIEALSLPPSNPVREALVDECVALGPEATPLFVRWLDPGEAALDKERFRAKQVVLAMLRMDTRAATGELLGLARQGSTEGRGNAARVLEMTPERERVRPELLAIFKSSQGQLRATLLRALLRLSSDDSQLLDEVLTGDDEALRDVALSVLTDTKNAGAEERVHRLLNDPARADQHAMQLLLYYQALPELVGPGHVKELIALASAVKVPASTRIAIIESLPMFVSGSNNELRRSLEGILAGADLKLSEAARVVLARLGDRVAKKELLKPYDDLVESTPKWSPAYFRRGDLLRRIGEYRDAEKDYTKALSLGRNDPNPQADTYIGLAKCAALQGHFKEAATWLQQAPIQLSQLKAYAGDPDFAKLKASKYGDVFPRD